MLDKILKIILINEDFGLMFKELVPDGFDVDVIEIVIHLLLEIYTRMWRKDFCYKLFKKGTKLKNTTRNTQIVLSNSDHRSKKRRKYEKTTKMLTNN